MRKDAIRQRITALEQSRRKFSFTPQQQHGHLDPPKPGEECVYTLHRCGTKAPQYELS